jgi:hypothetical protein
MRRLVPVVALLPALLLAGTGPLSRARGQGTPAPEPAWQWKAVSLGVDEKEATKRLNDLAADGWEYVGPLANGMVAFKRPNDAFQPRTKWVGKFTRQVAGEPPSDGGRFELTVLSRDGKTFTARVELVGNAGVNVVFVAKGTIADGKVEWRGKDVQVEKASPVPGGPRHDYSGRLTSNRLTLAYSGVLVADGKTPVSGTAVADLVK